MTSIKSKLVNDRLEPESSLSKSQALSTVVYGSSRMQETHEHLQSE